MIKKIKNYLTLKLKNKQKTFVFTFNQLLLAVLVFTSFLDSVSTYLVLSVGGAEINPIMYATIQTSIIFFFFVKIVVVPICAYSLVILLSDLTFYITKDNKTSDNSIFVFVGILSTVYFLASIYNFINYLILVL